MFASSACVCLCNWPLLTLLRPRDVRDSGSTPGSRGGRWSPWPASRCCRTQWCSTGIYEGGCIDYFIKLPQSKNNSINLKWLAVFCWRCRPVLCRGWRIIQFPIDNMLHGSAVHSLLMKVIMTQVTQVPEFSPGPCCPYAGIQLLSPDKFVSNIFSRKVLNCLADLLWSYTKVLFP